MKPVVADTAALILVGNELLSGKVAEANLVELAKTLRALGVRLMRVVVLLDDLPTIAREVRALAASHDVVFTSGGVGPTHDDVTVPAVAAAFDSEPVIDEGYAELVRKAYGERCTPEHLLMAMVPRGAVLAPSPDGAWPVPVMNNVWLLPGVPEVFREKLGVVRAFVRGGAPFVSRAVYTKLDEALLKPLLDTLVARHPAVEIGSYPRWFEPSYKTKVTFDARDQALVDAAADCLLAELPEGSLTRVE